MERTAWFDTIWGKLLFWGTMAATLVGIGMLIFGVGVEIQIPGAVFLFGFLGATVYAFTSFAKRFAEDGRYRLKILSRTMAVFPLVTGVYLLAFAFPGVSGELGVLAATGTDGEVVTSADRLVGGLVFLTGIYVSATLRALGGLAERMLGVSSESPDRVSRDDTQR